MEEKIREYIIELEIVIHKLLNELDNLDMNMGEKTTLPYNKLCMVNKIESKLQTVLEIKNDLQNILKEEKRENKNMNENNWISCNERLPELKDMYVNSYCRGGSSDFVLVWTSNGKIFEAECEKYEVFGNNPHTNITWYAYGTGGRRMAIRNKVLAWMPLPEPYRG